jgi:peptidoglycan/xylan/chitin deacetylase (PgdA/CDA1 family)
MLVRLLKKVKKVFRHQVIVLMYHRIADLETDPWQLAVSPENFEQQLQVLKRHFKVISLQQLYQQLSDKKIRSDSICITFDDGYSDNYQYAKPLLEKYECPATFFVSASYIGRNRQFWWDELESIILYAEELPGNISLQIGQQPFEFELDDRTLTDPLRQKHRYWNYLDKAPSQRCELYLKLWERLQPLTQNQMEPLLHEICKWARYTKPAREYDLPLSRGQLNELFDEPLFTIGIHTLTHSLLTALTPEMQQNEIAGCRKLLEEWSGKNMDSVSYPYGNYDDNTLSIIKKHNIATAFTTDEIAVTSESNASILGRFQVKNQNGSEFKIQLKDWFN